MASLSDFVLRKKDGLSSKVADKELIYRAAKSCLG